MQVFVVGVLVGVTTTFFGLLLLLSFSPDIGELVTPSIFSLLKDIVGPVAAGFGGAIAGAFAAYFLSRAESKRKRSEDAFEEVRKNRLEEVRQINIALVGLAAKLNDVLSIKKSYIDPMVDDRARFIVIPPFVRPATSRERISDQTTAMLACLPLKNATSLIYQADEGYFSLLDGLYTRGVVLQELRDLLERNKKHVGQPTLTLLDYVNAGGGGRLIALYLMTEDMLSLLTETAQSLADAILAVTEMAMERYKGLGIPLVTHKKLMSDSFFIPPPYFDSVESLKRSIGFSAK
ncbi:hypothetical protein [Pseudomonas nitroreducens]|uniref:hypothetical protein n=1 Tax=Pseudomonas nitroreducens TaxID=46680 RepID=UPI00265A3203|nr:hypothetical protein [Pseudomonas nitroreducens]MCP1651815.1 hypothetical protein [Pseudomonas nitroreducens]MCP1689557.1 hypothetical protein [Pseudomonas nitroreducens]